MGRLWTSAECETVLCLPGYRSIIDALQWPNVNERRSVGWQFMAWYTMQVGVIDSLRGKCLTQT